MTKKEYKEYCKSFEGETCWHCGQFPIREMHHIIGGSSKNKLRLEKFNLVPLCSHCHTIHHQCENMTAKFAHDMLVEFGAEWIEWATINRARSQRLNEWLIERGY